MVVALACMPYSPLFRPSLALGLLQAGLTRHGIESTSHYGSLRFAERIDAASYERISGAFSSSLAGEWTFSRAAFREDVGSSDVFFSELERTCPPAIYGSIVELLQAARAEAQAFVDAEAERILASSPRIVACTSTFEQHCASLALLRRISELDPSVITGMGGANCESTMGRATLTVAPWVDFVVSGEADLLWPELVERLLRDGKRRLLGALPMGVMTRARSSLRGVEKPPRAIVHDMDAVPIPEFEDYYEQYAASSLCGSIMLPVESARGCWWGAKSHCKFCGLLGEGMQFRSKSPERFVNELDALAGRYRTGNFMCTDNILDHRYFRSVLPELEARNYALFYETRSNLRKWQIKQLRESGVHSIQPGIEVLNDELSDLLDKGNRTWTSIQLLKWAAEQDLNVIWNLLVGIPGAAEEQYAVVAELIPRLVHLQPAGQIIPISFQRFSPYFDRPGEHGLSLVPAPAYRAVYPGSDELLGELAYLFVDQNAPLPGPAGLRSDADWGQRKLLEALVSWHRLHSGWSRPRLEFALTADGTILVEDTRPCATAERHRLSPLESRIYIACDRGRTFHDLRRELSLDAPLQDEVLQHALQSLCGDHLMLHSGDRYLSLATKRKAPRQLLRPGLFIPIEA